MKKKIFLPILGFVLLLLGYFYYNLYQQTKLDFHDSERCKEKQFVADNYFFITLYEYNSIKKNNVSAELIRNGKIINTYFKKNISDNYISFENEQIMLTDTIEVKVNEDIYYIHHFMNEFILNAKHHDCILTSYMINNYFINKVHDRFDLSQKYLN